MAEGANKEGFRGYCAHQPFNGLRIPVPVQNVLLRDFCNRNGMMFKLSVNELDFPGSYVQLLGLLGEIEALEGIVMASFFMLPSKAEERQKVFDTVLNAGAEMHFIIENQKLASREDAERIEDLFRMAKVLAHCPCTIDPALLGPAPGEPRFSTPIESG